MAEDDNGVLDAARRSFEQWRQRHGGPGRPIPDELWDEAVAVARTEGAEATARALRLDRGRLARRMALAAHWPASTVQPAGDAFVEIDMRPRCAPAHTLVRLEARDGERLEIALGAQSTLDLADLVRAFWSRSR